jgi:hypothetical protein
MFDRRHREFTNCSLKLTSCTFLKNGQDARSTKDEFSCGTGILPVHKRLIEKGKMPVPQRVSFLVGWAEEPALEILIKNDTRSQLKLTREYNSRLTGWTASSTKNELLVGLVFIFYFFNYKYLML